MNGVAFLRKSCGDNPAKILNKILLKQLYAPIIIENLFAFIDFLTGMERSRIIFPLFVKSGNLCVDNMMFKN